MCMRLVFVLTLCGGGSRDGQPITFVLRNKQTQFDYLYVTFEIGKEEPSDDTSSSSGRSRSGTNSSAMSASSSRDVVKGGEVD